ncbi:transcriptional regulator [Viridibacillus arenosi FSL R5-213]|uniref:Transcriptional regulator n=1 Tax=Viridibacillus arenosi FSL R5-213 TaxID=1227360 RepID=W4ER08_9BACL|nr:transcriptional regulator [Viridibacillus arenosi FSL R5-213]
MTTKGTIGAHTALTLDCEERIQKIIEAGRFINPDILVICHGGPIAEPADAEYVINKVEGICGFFGASSIERFAVEKGIREQSEAFKNIRS